MHAANKIEVVPPAKLNFKTTDLQHIWHCGGVLTAEISPRGKDVYGSGDVRKDAMLLSPGVHESVDLLLGMKRQAVHSEFRRQTIAAGYRADGLTVVPSLC